MELEPTRATLSQVTKSRNGEMVLIEDDVQNVVNSLHEIDPHLRVRFSEAGGYFVVYWQPEGELPGNGELVTTAQELDQRIVHLVRRLYHKAMQPGYSFADEIEKQEEKDRREREHRDSEQRGEALERLAHAMRKDAGYTDGKIFIPKGVKTND
jgi:hypothetical protein